MRKKQLVKQMEMLVAKNNELYNDNYKLVAEIAELKKEIESLKNQISSSANIITVDNENSEPSVSVKSIAEIESATPALESSHTDEEIINTSTNAEDAINVEISAPEIDLTSVCEGESANFATELIGKVVMHSATVCNTFAESGGQNAKDLINLAIGMTEVFKADALSIVTEKISDEDKNSKLLEKYTAATEYFDLLLTQIA